MARLTRLLLLTGAPGVGKTTVLRQLAGALGDRRLGGFYTEEIRVRGERQGFRAVTFDGRVRDMARLDFPPPRVGKYGVAVGVIDELAATALAPESGVEVYLVDEVGKMECLSSRFVWAMRALLGGDVPMVATVALRGTGLIAEITRRRGTELWQVTRSNRDGLAALALEWLAARTAVSP